ncbi:hypothetical protein L5F07_04240 [Aliarcobacter butzleri]|uniref:DUF3644 domain-containing protein n=2 Tax=Aliarcobacter butzleri TaxID=28197 RepID=A8EUL6_ALIB4|nr:hypothetical protein [Aliarcobacter butzleri]ABV67640.1 hypothetical protein Abu_1385 [Aliarcobacter butzleri RM4018]MBF7070611.1 hypothetical protein [Aliarcobacter butzleri]MCG3663200.1 hypothetical protein [Aliarcobacter butzleri]MCG3678462.1 hypothetical protein [Aliarcobacter butzleri]MCG3710419.1 hypothetical protein [Aliarcobacter butzleri]
MANLTFNQKQIFEKLFDRGGYVLNFSDRTFSEFFKDFGINIDAQKYHKNGSSKMKRLRAFWEIEENELVGNVLNGLLELSKQIDDIEDKDYKLAISYINTLLGIKSSDIKKDKELTENDLLKIEFSEINLSPLRLDFQFEEVINQRLQEIKKSLNSEASLSVIFLCGSTLEGLLLHLAIQNPQKFNSSKSAPKNNDGKVKQLHEWTLDNLINVAYEQDFIKLDIKKFSHTLKDFRNYIHPRQQALQNFNPDKHTAEISWKVLQAIIANLTGKRK